MTLKRRTGASGLLWCLLALAPAPAALGLSLAREAGGEGLSYLLRSRQGPATTHGSRRELSEIEKNAEEEIISWLRKGAAPEAAPSFLDEHAARVLADHHAAALEVLERWRGLVWWSFVRAKEHVGDYDIGMTLLSNDHSEEMRGTTELYGLGNYPVPPESVVFDVGGNVGKVAIIMAHIYHGVRVVTFEPSELNRFFLELNLAINNVPYIPSGGHRDAGGSKFVLGAESFVEVRGEAITNSTGTEDFAFQPMSADESGLDPSHRSMSAEYSSVRTITIEDAMKELGVDRVRLMKIDCEGCEFEVFPALSNATLDRIDSLVGEYHAHLEPFHQDEIEGVRRVACARGWVFHPQLVCMGR
uniref:Methyltransferase FkbM domain-containing protein n=1 Tax=Alexandrium catenella TaxID=2925 RepID=A0A7S1PPW4_ALECA